MYLQKPKTYPILIDGKIYAYTVGIHKLFKLMYMYIGNNIYIV